MADYGALAQAIVDQKKKQAPAGSLPSDPTGTVPADQADLASAVGGAPAAGDAGGDEAGTDLSLTTPAGAKPSQAAVTPPPVAPAPTSTIKQTPGTPQTATPPEQPTASVQRIADALSGKGSADYLRQLSQVDSDPRFAHVVPSETRQELHEAIAAAKEAYQAQVGKNEWLDVAQTLGRAIAQFGAAAKGTQYGRDMSHLDMGAPIDYNARSRQAADVYGMGVKGAQDEYHAAQDDAKEANSGRENQKRDLLHTLQFGAEEGRKQDRETLTDDATRRRDADRMAHDKTLAEIAAGRQGKSDDRADNRAKLQAESEKAKADRQEKALAAKQREEQGRQLDRDIPAEDKATQAGQALLGDRIRLAGDVDRRTRAEIEKRDGALAAQSGMDLSALDDEVAHAPTKKVPGKLWGTNEVPDTDALRTNLLEHSGLRSRLDALRDKRTQRDQIRAGTQAGQGGDQAVQSSGGGGDGVTAVASGTKMITPTQLQTYATQYKMSPADAAQYLSSHGYTLTK